MEKPAQKKKPPAKASTESKATESREKANFLRSPYLIAIGAAVVAVIVLLLLLSGGDGGSDSTESQTTQSAKAVQVVSQSGLLGAIKGAGYPVFWAGPRLGVEYEVSRPEEGRTYVRYLPKGEEAESEKAFLTVGSYKQSEALPSIEEQGQKPGAVLVKITGGGVAYAEGPDATSAYMAIPGTETEVEVFDPEGGQALQLIRSGAIVPIG